MKLLNKFLIIVLGVLLFTGLANGNLLAQGENDKNDFPWEIWWIFSGVFCFMPIIAFIAWIVIGVWMYKDAEKRGKDGALWLIIGLLFGIIGLIIWLIVRPPEKSAGKASTGRACPDCGRTIPFDANICPYCGKKFE